jgi:glycosyltransferase involved in cell wall biosynthesis
MTGERPERLLLHREASPLSRGGLERRLLSSAGFAVYDFDDALYADWGGGGRLRSVAPKAPKALIGVRTADRVIAGNPTLAEWASEHNADVVVIPSCVAPERYRRKEDYAVGDPPRLGWIGSAGNEAYLRLVDEALFEVNRRTGARLTLIGTNLPTLGRLEEIIDRVEWSEADQHVLLAALDVGLGPVPDTPYTRGKSGYKLLQYGAAGTPMVASPIGVNREILNAFGMPSADDTATWVDGIIGLLTASTERRAELGRGARDVVERRYSFEAWLPAWTEAVGLGATADRAEHA